MKKYKLIKELPGIPVGITVKLGELPYLYDESSLIISHNFVKNYPEYIEEIPDQSTTVIELIDSMIEENESYLDSLPTSGQSLVAQRINVLELLKEEIGKLPGFVNDRNASIMHEIWSQWYIHQRDNSTPGNIARWNEQSTTPYSELTEEDKEKDKDQLRKFIL